MGFWGLNPGPDSPVLLSLPTPPALHPGLLSASEYTDLLDSPCISFRTLSPTFTWSSLFISNSTRTRPATLLKGCGSTRNHPAYRTPRIYSPFFIEKLALLGSRAWFLEPHCSCSKSALLLPDLGQVILVSRFVPQFTLL